MSENHFAIIGGSNKCGTTSLFRYLSDHPAIRPSRKKELRFFSSPRFGSRNEILQEYCREFIADKSAATMLLEASPQYLHAGRQRAATIHGILPEARLIFILRDPVDRLVSYYKSAYGQPDRPSYQFAFEDVVNLGLAALNRSEDSEAARSFSQEIRMAHYARYLEEYAEVWPLNQMKIVFFESFVAKLRREIADVANFLNCDPEFYEEYTFEVENRTRGHRIVALRRLAMRIYARTEPFFANRSGLKRSLRHMYDCVNEVEHPIEIETPARDKLRFHYGPSVRNLREWMAKSYPQQELPSWVVD